MQMNGMKMRHITIVCALTAASLAGADWIVSREYTVGSTKYTLTAKHYRGEENVPWVFAELTVRRSGRVIARETLADGEGEIGDIIAFRRKGGIVILIKEPRQIVCMTVDQAGKFSKPEFQWDKDPAIVRIRKDDVWISSDSVDEGVWTTTLSTWDRERDKWQVSRYRRSPIEPKADFVHSAKNPTRKVTFTTVAGSPQGRAVLKVSLIDEKSRVIDHLTIPYLGHRTVWQSMQGSKRLVVVEQTSDPGTQQMDSFVVTSNKLTRCRGASISGSFFVAMRQHNIYLYRRIDRKSSLLYSFDFNKVSWKTERVMSDSAVDNWH